MVNLEMTDAAVTHVLSVAPEPWKEQRLIEGENHDVEIAEIKLAIRDLGAQDLPDAEYDSRLAELRAERDRLASLPNIPDHWEEVDTGLTVGQHWANLSRDGKRAMLFDNVKVYAEPTDPEIRKLAPGKVSPMIRIESRLFTLPKFPVEYTA